MFTITDNSVSLENRIVYINFHDGKYWCKFKPLEKGSVVESIGMPEKDWAVEWAKKILLEWRSQ